MDTVFSFEMLVYKQKTTLCNNPEHQNLNSHRHENQIVLAALSISININRLLKFSTKIGCKKKGKKMGSNGTKYYGRSVHVVLRVTGMNLPWLQKSLFYGIRNLNPCSILRFSPLLTVHLYFPVKPHNL
jgi:hypothetical protein